MLKSLTTKATGRVVPLTPVAKRDLAGWLKTQPASLKAWVRDTGFGAAAGEVSLVPAASGRLERVLLGLGAGDGGPWTWGGLAGGLPKGAYRIAPAPDRALAADAALGWALGGYRFGRYRDVPAPRARLLWPKAADKAAVERAAAGTFLARDLINTPANDMGPPDLAAAARALARRFGARCRVIAGDDLLRRNFPAIHAVGRASSRPPCLIDLAWGPKSAPTVTLVGKGVCFDSGGLDLKSSSNMKLMKKDMGGAANVLGLASMIMAARLKVSLRVLIPAVENSVSGNAMRPMDVIPTRKGLTVEIGNTDAEGRVILADALAEACAGEPDLLIDFATLTGAARVALGTDVPAFFCNDDRLAADLAHVSSVTSDPLWRLPLWRPYREQIVSKVADLNNAPSEATGGAITAALFLAEFIKSGIPWIHIDLMAWNARARPGRPEGGEAQGMRAVFALIEARVGA